MFTELAVLSKFAYLLRKHAAGYDELTSMTDPRVSSELGSLYPHLSSNELALAEDALEEYLKLIFAIAERIEADPEVYAEFLRLTAETRPATIQEVRDYLSSAH